MSLRKRRLYEFLPYIHLINEDGMLGHYCLIGGFASEAWRSVFYKKLLQSKEEWDQLSEAEQGFLKYSILSKDIDFRAAVEVVNSFRRQLKYKKESSLGNDRLRMDSITFFVFDDIKDSIKPNAMDEYAKQIEIMNRLEGIDAFPMTVAQGITTVENLRNELTGSYEQVGVLDPLSLLLIKHRIATECKPEGKEREHINLLSVVIPFYLKEAQAAFKAGKIHRDPAIVANRLRNQLKASAVFKEIVDDPVRFHRLIAACDEVAQGETREFYETNVPVVLPAPASSHLNQHKQGKLKIAMNILRNFGRRLKTLEIR